MLAAEARSQVICEVKSQCVFAVCPAKAGGWPVVSMICVGNHSLDQLKSQDAAANELDQNYFHQCTNKEAGWKE